MQPGDAVGSSSEPEEWLDIQTALSRRRMLRCDRPAGLCGPSYASIRLGR